MKYYFIIDKEGNLLGPSKDLKNKGDDRAVVLKTPRPITEEHEKKWLADALLYRLAKSRYPSYLQSYIGGKLEQVDIEHLK